MLNYSANGPSGYNLTNSLRFRESASPYLSRTPTIAGNQQKYTWSGWVKRGSLSAYGFVLQAGASSTTNGNTLLGLGDNGSAYISFYSTASHVYETAALFRDPSAWYHIVFALDTTQATAANRVKMYVNGVQITLSVSSGYTAVPQNFNCAVNNTVIHVNGAYRNGAGNLVLFYDGYQTEINFIDGQQLTPSSFGNTNSATGVWQPAKYTGTYGTNGFYLNFNSIALTSGSNTGLGKDNSGNGNYWNTNNISVTAGTTYDAMTDVPTLTSATVANYCVLNPLIPITTTTVINGNLGLSSYNGSSSVFGTMGVSSGKWYYEMVAYADALSGISGTLNGGNFPGQLADSYCWDSNNATKISNSTGVAYGSATSNGDIVGVALDLDVGTLTFYKNNTSQGTAYSSISGTYFPVFRNGSATNTSVNFGQRPFAYTPPSGYKALNTYNLPSSTIPQGNKVMDATTYTGNGSTQTITNAGAFKPDFIWFKNRSGANNHALYDSVRGRALGLISNATNAEQSASAGNDLVSFDSGGFSLGPVEDFTSVNGSAQSIIAWQWQAGQGTTSSNTSGSITSTVSVNTTAGFSVVTYTGTGSSGTVGHGLGVTPSMIIVKQRSTTGGWFVNHSAISATQNLYLQATDSVQSDNVYASRSSTTFGITGSSGINGSGVTFVAYCWAEIAGFSKFGSYTGNASTDGPFIYTGFRPKYVLIKASSGTTGNWVLLDTSRDTYNMAVNVLEPDVSDAEAALSPMIDILSNGFKVRRNSAGVNGSGYTYIYMAFAENPFKNALAR